MKREINLKDCVILLVEDDKLAQLVFQSSLKTTGARILLAENGCEALDVLQGEYVHVDIIFMDIIMPHMNGLEAAEKIRGMTGKYQNIPIIAWTASWYKNPQEIFQDGLFSQCLIKPTDKELLLDTAEHWWKAVKLLEETKSNVS